MTVVLPIILTIGINYLLGYWDEINWKLTKPPEGYEWDFRKMIIDSSKGISERKNSTEEAEVDSILRKKRNNTHLSPVD